MPTRANDMIQTAAQARARMFLVQSMNDRIKPPKS